MQLQQLERVQRLAASRVCVVMGEEELAVIDYSARCGRAASVCVPCVTARIIVHSLVHVRQERVHGILYSEILAERADRLSSLSRVCFELPFARLRPREVVLRCFGPLVGVVPVSVLTEYGIYVAQRQVGSALPRPDVDIRRVL